MVPAIRNNVMLYNFFRKKEEVGEGEAYWIDSLV
jgi:hypothetical protein